MLLISRFTTGDGDALVERARDALRLLTATPGCLRGRLVRSTEADDRWVLVVEFESVAAYRRALSPLAVREAVIPLLGAAEVDEPAAYEVVLDGAAGEVAHHQSLLAADASTVRLGEASGPAKAR